MRDRRYCAVKFRVEYKRGFLVRWISWTHPNMAVSITVFVDDRRPIGMGAVFGRVRNDVYSALILEGTYGEFGP